MIRNDQESCLMRLRRRREKPKAAPAPRMGSGPGTVESGSPIFWERVSVIVSTLPPVRERLLVNVSGDTVPAGKVTILPGSNSVAVEVVSKGVVKDLEKARADPAPEPAALVLYLKNSCPTGGLNSETV